jgi:hypothetical protein
LYQTFVKKICFLVFIHYFLFVSGCKSVLDECCPGQADPGAEREQLLATAAAAAAAAGEPSADEHWVEDPPRSSHQQTSTGGGGVRGRRPTGSDGDEEEDGEEGGSGPATFWRNQQLRLALGQRSNSAAGIGLPVRHVFFDIFLVLFFHYLNAKKKLIRYGSRLLQMSSGKCLIFIFFTILINSILCYAYYTAANFFFPTRTMKKK